MTDENRKTPYWYRYSDGGPTWRDPRRTPPGEDLAAMRIGEGREAFTVPSMWPYLTKIADDGFADPRTDSRQLPAPVVAEHHALVVFGIHQQSQALPVHRKSAGLGEAVKRLHTSDRFSEDAVGRRFYAAVTADELGELTHHLRGLVRQLRSLPGVVPLDYDRLQDDFRRWQQADTRAQVRRRWGRGYHANLKGDPKTSVEAEPT